MAMKYAVLFKTHFWDEFCERQLARLKSVCSRGDIFVFVDQTPGFTSLSVPYPVIHAAETSSSALDLEIEPKGKLFWYCNDYPMYFLFDKHPDYEFFVIIEYDVACRLSLDDLVEAVSACGYDMVAQPHAMPIDEWHWAKTGDGIYRSRDEMRHGLFCFCIFSSSAVAMLLRRRRELSSQRRSAAIQTWPYGELFMATEVHRAGMKAGRLSEFGCTSRYDWWPPTLELRVGAAEEPEFIHPFLDETRYLQSCLKFAADLSTYFDPDSELRQRLDLCARQQVIMLLLAEARKRKQLPILDQIKRLAELDGIDTSCNIARAKATTQSSVSPWSHFDNVHRDSGGAVDGQITGSYGFHTGEDEPAWWMVDLGGLYVVSRVVVHNRLDVRQRGRGLALRVSSSGVEWTILSQSATDSDFGGADGQPLDIIADPPTDVRFLRIETPGRGMLHLDQVEVFGEPIG